MPSSSGIARGSSGASLFDIVTDLPGAKGSIGPPCPAPSHAGYLPACQYTRLTEWLK